VKAALGAPAGEKPAAAAMALTAEKKTSAERRAAKAAKPALKVKKHHRNGESRSRNLEEPEKSAAIRKCGEEAQKSMASARGEARLKAKVT